MDNENGDVKLALEEMRLNMQESINVGNALDQKVILTLIVLGVILAITYVIQIVFNRFCPEWYLRMLAAVTVLVTLWVINPQHYRRAMASDWDELETHIFGRLERDAIFSLLSGYVDQIQYNHQVNFGKVIVLRFSLVILLFATIILAAVI